MKMTAVIGLFLAGLALPAALRPQSIMGDVSGHVWSKEETRSDDGGSLTVESDPAYAEVYLDLVFLGRAPVETGEPAPGLHRLTVKKSGYYPVEFWFTYTENTDLSFQVTLQQITGFLSITSVPANAEIVVAGMIVGQGVAELPVGNHSLTVRAFGYESYDTLVSIAERETTTLQVVLSPAKFQLSGFGADRDRFNPGGPGRLGTVRIGFTVSSWGSGGLSITDSKGSQVWAYEFPPFATWNQAVEWDGGDTAGTLVHDGRYTATIHALSAAGDVEVVESVEIVVDSSIRIDYRPVWHGQAGLLFAPSAVPLSKGVFQGSFLLAVDVQNPDGNSPFLLSARSGLLNSLEAAAWCAFLPGQEDLPFGGGLSVKYGLFDSAWISGALAAALSYWNNKEADPLTSYSGVSFAAAVEIGPPWLRLLIAPQMTVSLWDPEGSADQTMEAEPLVWGYLRGGLAAAADPFWFGFSGAVRTERFDRAFSMAGPVETGLELHFLAPGTFLVISAFAACSWPIGSGNAVDAALPESFSVGMGIGLLH